MKQRMATGDGIRRTVEGDIASSPRISSSIAFDIHFALLGCGLSCGILRTGGWVLTRGSAFWWLSAGHGLGAEAGRAWGGDGLARLGGVHGFERQKKTQEWGARKEERGACAECGNLVRRWPV